MQISKISEDVEVLKLELTPRVHRRDRDRHALVSDRDSEFQSVAETRDGESDFFDFSDFSDEESNMKRQESDWLMSSIFRLYCRVGEVLQEVDGRDLECQTGSVVCDEMLKLLVDLCPIRGHNQPLDTSSIPSCGVAHTQRGTHETKWCKCGTHIRHNSHGDCLLRSRDPIGQ